MCRPKNSKPYQQPLHHYLWAWKWKRKRENVVNGKGKEKHE